MTAVVIDTNVLQVANNNAPQARPDCVLAVVARLRRVRQGERVCLDRTGFMLQEYMNQGFSHAGQPGFGDAFFKYVFENQANARICEQVDVTPTDATGTDFAEFPSDSDLAAFDPSDRKFAAVALVSPSKPPVLNAVDSDWWNAREALTRNGLTIEFVCEGQFKD